MAKQLKIGSKILHSQLSPFPSPARMISSLDDDDDDDRILTLLLFTMHGTLKTLYFIEYKFV